MRKDSKGKLYRYAFDSLPELFRYIDDTKRTWSVNQSVTNRPQKSWDLSCNYQQAMTLARDGWLEGAAKVQEALRTLALKSPAPDTRVDFYGHLPHVPRYCAGAPDSMIRHTRDATSGMGKVLTLYVPVNAVGMVPAECMRNFGVAVAQYVNQLETDGTRVELHGVICSMLHGDTRRVAHSWRIKSADAPLDLAVVAFSIGHPAMFRRLGFALRERCDVRTDACYGRSDDITLDDVIDPPSGAYALNGMRLAHKTSRTPEAAVEYVTRQLDRMLGADFAAADEEGL